MAISERGHFPLVLQLEGMGCQLSTPRSLHDWLVFAGGVFLLVVFSIVLTTIDLVNALGMGASAVVLPSGPMVALVLVSRQFSKPGGSQSNIGCFSHFLRGGAPLQILATLDSAGLFHLLGLGKPHPALACRD